MNMYQLVSRIGSAEMLLYSVSLGTQPEVVQPVELFNLFAMSRKRVQDGEWRSRICHCRIQ